MQHILAQESKENSFPPLQKRIILYLAQSKPQTINEIKTGIKGHYKSTHTSFKALEKKGLVQNIASKHYRGRQYPCFWLTELGIFFALHEGAKQEVLLRTTLEIYPENKNLQFIIEGVPILGKHALRVLYLAVLTKGEIEQRDITSLFAAQMQEKLTPKQQRQFLAIIKKYPEPYQKLRDYINQIQKNLRELSDLL